MTRTLLRAFRRRPRVRGARAFVLAVLGVIAIGSAAEASHAHESDLEAAQCVVCQWQDHRLEADEIPTPEVAPPIRVVETPDDLPPRTSREVRIRPPSTGPPAAH